MSGNIFASEAPKYWKSSYSVIPIAPGGKRPSFNGWNHYVENLPNPKSREDWVSSFNRHGIGLILGREVTEDTVLIAIDIDDDTLVEAVTIVMGSSPVAKRGKKGLTIFAVSPKGEIKKGFKFKTEKSKPRVEVLARGNQTVLPPTRHPETNSPYEWVGRPLLEIDASQLPILDRRRFELLKVLAESPETLELAKGEGTHDPALPLSIKLARAGSSRQEHHGAILSLLPDVYSGNLPEELDDMFDGAVEIVDSTAISDEQDAVAAKMMRLVLNQGVELATDENNIPILVLPAERGPRIAIDLKSEQSIDWLLYQYQLAFRRTASERQVKEALFNLRPRALFSGRVEKASMRVAGNNQRIGIDLGPNTNTLVVIDKSGWSLQDGGDFVFRRPDGMADLPKPDDTDGGLREFRQLLGVDQQTWTSILAFILSSFLPQGPYPWLSVSGRESSGKSTLGRMLKRLIDPAYVELDNLPGDDRDLAVLARHAHMIVFDNVSSIKGDTSDTLATLSTGGGLSRRQLFTDSNIHRTKYELPFVANGIGAFAHRPDLLRRAIGINLPAIEDGRFVDQNHVLARFDELMPRILGEIFYIISEGIRNYAQTAVPPGISMADAARWLAAMEPAVDLDGFSFAEAIRASQHEAKLQRNSTDPVIALIVDLVETRPWKGNTTDLYHWASEQRYVKDSFFPRSASALGNQLSRKESSLKAQGINAEKFSDGKQRFWRFWRNDQDPTKATDSVTAAACPPHSDKY